MMRILAAVAAGGCLSGTAMAEAPEWKGEGSLSAGLNTGNTDTSDLGIGVKMGRKTPLWRMSGELLADYGTKNGTQTKDRLYTAGQVDRVISDRLFGFTRVSHERDDFSAFESRSFAGGGLGWQAFDNDLVKWSLEGGPGIKVDEVKATTVTPPGGVPAPVPGKTRDSVAVIAASRLNYTLNEQVRAGNETSLIYANTSTQIANKATLTASLTRGLSARFSFEVRHDTNPRTNFEKTDTASRMSIVYSFGG